MGADGDKKLPQRMKINGLCEMGIAARVVRPLAVLGSIVARYRCYRNVRQMILPPDPVRQSQPAFFPQVNIEQDRVRQGLRRDPNESILQRSRKYGFITLAFQPVLEHLAEYAVILHYENPWLHGLFPNGK